MIPKMQLPVLLLSSAELIGVAAQMNRLQLGIRLQHLTHDLSAVSAVLRSSPLTVDVSDRRRPKDQRMDPRISNPATLAWIVEIVEDFPLTASRHVPLVAKYSTNVQLVLLLGVELGSVVARLQTPLDALQLEIVLD